jgi:hypothetical protein
MGQLQSSNSLALDRRLAAKSSHRRLSLLGDLWAKAGNRVTLYHIGFPTGMMLNGRSSPFI